METSAVPPPTFSPPTVGVRDQMKGIARGVIGKHPVTTALVLGALIVLVLILAYKYYARRRKGDHFQTMSISNLTTGNNNPHWQLGSMDAGNGGPVTRDATPYNIAVWHPAWRAGHHHRVHPAKLSREHLVGGPAPGSPCDPGEVLVTYTDSDGNKQAYCKQEGSLPGPGTVCQDSAWTPDATAEAQALATVGSLQHDDYGERPLQRAINGAYDADAGLADEDLATLMHQGGTP